MGTVFKINGDVVSHEEWEGLRKDLPTDPITLSALLDDTLTQTELDDIFKSNEKDRIPLDIFKDWKPNRFDNVAQILAHHHFNIEGKLSGNFDLFHPSQGLWSSREFVLAAMKQNPKDPALLTQWVQADIRRLENLDPSLQNSVWQKLCKLHDWSPLLPKKNLKTYAAWKRGLKKIYNIEFTERFRSIDVLHAVVALRHNPRSLSQKPLATLFGPKIDPNGAFVEYPLIDRLTELGYQVFYYEAAKENEIDEDLAEATQGGKYKADVIFLEGHGTATTLNLSGRDLLAGEMKDETRYIDTSDFDKPTPDIHFAQFIKPTGDLVQYSCFNGEGRESNPNNLANSISHHLPEGVTIHASDQSINIQDISRDLLGKLQVTWTKDSLYTPKGGRE